MSISVRQGAKHVSMLSDICHFAVNNPVFGDKRPLMSYYVVIDRYKALKSYRNENKGKHAINNT